jgi:hypothetical protein
MVDRVVGIVPTLVLKVLGGVDPVSLELLRLLRAVVNAGGMANRSVAVMTKAAGVHVVDGYGVSSSAVNLGTAQKKQGHACQDARHAGQARFVG